MANNFFKEQYENSPQIRRGIDTILKSNSYTDEYKDKIRSYLEGIDVDKLYKEDSLSVSEGELPRRITLSTRQGITDGYIEKPRYNEEEIKRALDIEVDELIALPPEQRPETVLKSRYDDLLELYRGQVAAFTDLTDEYNASLSEIENLKLEIESLNQIVDAEKLLTAVANNEADAANERFAALLGDFQSALQKGIQEAIERVSLEAQVRGLQAQKEVLRTQLEAQVSVSEQQQNELIASTILTGIANSFGLGSSSGWKVDSGFITKPNDVLKGQTIRFESERDEWRWANGEFMDLYNLTEEEAVFTFKYEVVSGGHSQPWLGGPASVTVPPREEANPGITRIQFRKVRNINDPKGRKLDFKDRVIITSSVGDEFAVGATFYRRLRSGGAGN